MGSTFLPCPKECSRIAFPVYHSQVLKSHGAVATAWEVLLASQALAELVLLGLSAKAKVLGFE